MTEITVISIKKHLLKEPEVKLRVDTKNNSQYYTLNPDDVIEIVEKGE